MENINNIQNSTVNQLSKTNQKKNINKTIRKAQTMGKNEFLKLLVTQLSHQDPLKPMEDKEFISQMAQFSTLEQMVEMNKNMSGMTKKMNSTADLNRAFFFLGKNVKVLDTNTNKVISGKVQEVDLSNPKATGVKVNNRTFKLNQIIGIVTSEGNNLSSDKVVENKK